MQSQHATILGAVSAAISFALDSQPEFMPGWAMWVLGMDGGWPRVLSGQDTSREEK